MRRLLLATLLFLLTLVAPAVVHANVNDFRITNFTSDQTLTKTEADQAALHIIERITVRFTDNNHGITRSIPTTQGNRSLEVQINKVSSSSGAPASFTKTVQNGSLTLKIGDPAHTVTGVQEYTIDYTVQNVLQSYSSQDTLYWNINGFGWPQETDKISAAIHLPDDATLSDYTPRSCYVGAKAGCTIDQQGNTVRVVASGLQSYQSLSYTLNFAKGYFTPVAQTANQQYVTGSGVNNFVISNFASDQTLTRDDKQGTLRIVERIEVEFTANNHGIIRAIPNSYKWHPLKFHLNSISSDTGAPVNVKMSNSNGNVVLKIGDPDRTVTGHQEYVLDYTLRNVIGFYGSHDELYWDVNGDEWDQSVTNVSVVLHLPSDLRLIDEAPRCYAGAFGNKQSNCIISLKDNTITASAANLGGRETLSYVVGFQKGYFTQATILDWVRDYATLLFGVVGLPLLAFVGGFAWWYRKGRDAAGRGTIVPQYAPPAGISPIQAGAILDFSVDNRDITAMFIDLARRKYIRIIEERKDRLILGDKITYKLELLRSEGSDLTVYEKTLLSSVFKSGKLMENAANGKMVELSSLANEFYTTANSLRTSVSRDLTRDGYFSQDPKKFLVKVSGLFSFVYLGFFLFGFAIQLHMLGLLVGTIIAAIILFLFARAMPARTSTGVAAKEQLLGLKMYMETAEKDRLKMLESPSAPYANNAGEPQRTVELFEQLLPYAIVMKVEKEWADQFKNIYPSPPDWYNGNVTSFNTGYLIGSLNSGFASTVNTSFSAPSSSGSSGFGGGGFSGGGGGGGGGGGW